MRKKMSRRQSNKKFSRGNRINKRNIKLPVTQRGGYRI